MNLPNGVRRLLRLRDPSRDVDEELRFHFDRTVAELCARGSTRTEAEREAAQRFGDVSRYRRELEGIDRGMARAWRRAHHAEAISDAIRQASRSVVRSRALSTAVVLTLTLGLGANVTVFAIVERLLLTPPAHVADPQRVYRLMVETRSEPDADDFYNVRVANGVLAYPDVKDAAAAPALAGAAVWAEQLLTMGHGLEARQLDGIAVSPGYFELLGARPRLGRFLMAEDNEPSAERTAVISHALWQAEYGGTSDVLGRTLDFGSGVHTIVGVAPRGMTSLRLAPVDVWLPLHHAMVQSRLESRNYWGFAGVVRLREGVAEALAEDQMTALLRRGRAEIGNEYFDPGSRMIVTPLLEAHGPTAGGEAAVVKWLSAVALIVLLIACVNVANLLLARAVRQSREFAVRLALGVSRTRLVGQTLLEGVMLGAIGGAAALLLARWVGAAAAAELLPDIAWTELGWTARLVPVTLLVACAAGLAAAFVPALHTLRPALLSALRGAGAGAIQRSTSRTRTALAIVQSALSVVLLVGAGLFVRSFEAARAADLGYDMRDLHYVNLRFAPGSTTTDERIRVWHDALQRLQAHPAVDVAAASSSAPFYMSMSDKVRLPGRDSLPSGGPRTWLYYRASSDYFRLLNIRPVRGRVLTAADASTGARVAVVNESMASTLWPDSDPIGTCMLVGSDPECVEVVGVVRDNIQRALREDLAMQYWMPLSRDMSVGVLMVRPRPGAGDAADAIRRATVEMDPRIRMVDVIPAHERLEPQLRSWRLGAALFSAFGVLALLVSMVGLYAVIAFDVSQRTREIGVRSALGATRGRIVRLVFGRAITVAALGIAAGGSLAATLAPRLRETLYEVSPYDPATYLAVALALLAVASLAALAPANRAARVDPNVALRAD